MARAPASRCLWERPPGRAGAAVRWAAPPSATATPAAPSNGATGGAAAEPRSAPAAFPAAAAGTAAAAAATNAGGGVPSSELLQEPGVVVPGTPASEEDGEEANPLHSSWYIYEQPGNPCVVCCGRGVNKCLYCYGDGYLLIGPDQVRDRQECPVCAGRKSDTCRRCQGSGVRPSTSMNAAGEEEPNMTNAEVCAAAAAEGAAYLATGASPDTEMAVLDAAAAAAAAAKEAAK